MANTKPADEEISEIDAKIAQLKKKKRNIQNRVKSEERKARTRRLIQIGAEVEAYCGEITNLESFKKYLEQYSYAIKRTQQEAPDTSGTTGSNFEIPEIPEEVLNSFPLN